MILFRVSRAESLLNTGSHERIYRGHKGRAHGWRGGGCFCVLPRMLVAVLRGLAIGLALVDRVRKVLAAVNVGVDHLRPTPPLLPEPEPKPE